MRSSGKHTKRGYTGAVLVMCSVTSCTCYGGLLQSKVMVIARDGDLVSLKQPAAERRWWWWWQDRSRIVRKKEEEGWKIRYM